MADRPSVSLQLRAYLSGLPARTRMRLLVELERAVSGGADDPVQRFLLDEVRAVVQAHGDPAPRIPDPMRLFFDPIDHFLVDRTPRAKVPGRIPRQVATRIWTWAARDVVANQVRALAIDLTHLLGPEADSEDYDDEALSVIGEFRLEVVGALRNALEKARREPGAHRRLSAQIGGERAVEELDDILALAETVEARREILARLPPTIDPNDANAMSAAATALAAAERLGRRDGVFLAWEIRPRLTDLSRVPAAVAMHVGSEEAKVVSGQPFGRLIDLVVRELEDGAENLSHAIATGGDAARILRDLVHVQRQLRAAIDLDEATSDWSNALTAVRRDVSQRVSEALGEVPQLLRRSMRPLRAFGTRQLARPDEIDVERVCRLLRVFDAAKLHGSEMALGEIVQRLKTEIEGYVTQSTTAIVDEARAPPDGRRDILMAHAASAVRVNEALFGATEASLVRRSIEVAAGAKLPLPAAA